MSTVKINVTAMFSHREPWDCANSVANLGDQAGRLTWMCAMEVARSQGQWLLCSGNIALDWVRSDARSTGAWDREEIEAWEDTACLAYLVQTVATDMRLLGSDDHELAACVAKYEATDWGNASSYPCAHFWLEGGVVYAEINS